MLRVACVAALGLALAGCGADEAPTATAPITAEQLCVSSACGERVVLLDIPSAENLTFSADGRLFVSSGQVVYEIHKNADDSFRAEVISSGNCGFTGLAIRNDVLYAACGSGTLWAGMLDPTPRLEPIHTLSGMCLPNGLALGADGALYVVDEPLNLCAPTPQIVRIELDPANPLRVAAQATWLAGSALGQLHLGLDNVLRFPNGLQADGRQFFGTDGGSVYRVDLQDGQPGPVMPLHFEVGIHDDLGLVAGGILVADFLNGRIELLSREGARLQATDAGLFTSPSSVRLAHPPMFAPTDILVTETGVLGDQNLPLDHLSLFRRKTP